MVVIVLRVTATIIIIITMTTAIITTLIVTTAYRRRGREAPSIGTFPQLLAALHVVAPTLETLKLSDCIPSMSTSTELSQPPVLGRVITFPRLASASFVGIADDCPSLLHHISCSLPRCAHLEVIGCGRASPVIALTNRVSTHFAGALHTLHVMMDPIGIRVDFEGWMEENLDSDARDLHLGIAAESPDELLLPPPSVIMEAASPMLARLKSLRLTLRAPGTNTQLVWADLFARTPQLESLILSRPPTSDFWTTLCTQSHTESGQVHLCLPRLQVLELDDPDSQRYPRRWEAPSDDRDFVSALIEWATFRKLTRAPIEEIRLTRCECVRPEHVSQLQAVVANVKWEPN